MAKNYDIAIIGGGIMGLAHAIHAVRAGLKTAVFERDAKGQGASVRNFGMLAIVAQAPGPQLDSARLSLGIWQEIAAQTGLSLLQAGCLFLARRQEEMAVLQESVSAQGQDDLALKLLTKSEVSDICPHVVSPKIQGGVWSPDAWKVDQRDALEKISQWLIQMGVDFHFSTPVIQASSRELETGRDRFCANQIILCGGDEFEALFPKEFSVSGITRCRLQMLRTEPQPQNFTLKPFVLGGLSLPRYSSFANCPSLPTLVEYQKKHLGPYVDHGIHVIAAQEGDGSITIGDSHSYGVAHKNEALPGINDLILAELDELIELKHRKIHQSWVGHYAYKAGQDVAVLKPKKGITAVTMTNGQGMTHAFSVAQNVMHELLV